MGPGTAAIDGSERADAPAGGPTGRIGPNAITRVAEALHAEVGAARTRALFGHAQVEHHLQAPPQHMVDEGDVRRLHRALYELLGAEQARRVSRTAGDLTGAYLLRHRIPAAVQLLLRLLPAPLAARLLGAAIARHAWTFAGSGSFRARSARPVCFTLSACPICHGVRATTARGDYYAACFQRLFRTLVSRRATVTETTCEATGSDACRFEVLW